MRRTLLPWVVAFGIAVLGTVGTVATLNATMFGPGAFVQVYLDALARGDASDALSLPGVDAGGRAAGASTALLRDGALAGLSDIHQTGDESRAGDRWITFDWTSPHSSGTTTFQVKRIGTRFGLFPEWGFAVSPVATVSLAVEHDPHFTVNGAAEVSATTSNAPSDYAVLVPGSYTFAHGSRYLTATPRLVLADTVGQNLSVQVDIQANARFVAAVDARLRAQLTACAKQTVLFPTGCPFGQAIDNRVSSAPAWSIVSYPTTRIEPGVEFGSWVVPGVAGTAHLRVSVTSLYDGKVTTFDQDVPFQLRARLAFGADGSITVDLR